MLASKEVSNFRKAELERMHSNFPNGCPMFNNNQKLTSLNTSCPMASKKGLKSVNLFKTFFDFIYIFFYELYI